MKVTTPPDLIKALIREAVGTPIDTRIVWIPKMPQVILPTGRRVQVSLYVFRGCLCFYAGFDPTHNVLFVVSDQVWKDNNG